MKSLARVSRWLLPLSVMLASSVAFGAVHREGSWPDADKPISIDASGLSRSDAVKRVADAAGWSIVVHAPAGDPVDLHVKNQPAAKVLDLVLDDADYVARRDGALIQITRTKAGNEASPPTSASVGTSASAVAPQVPAPPPSAAETATPPPPVPPVPPPPAVASAPNPPPPPATTKKGEDRVVTGGSLRIEKDEVVDDVTVMGGSVDVDGTVTGDLVVMGGAARVHPGASVHGDATAIGGTLDIEDDATVDGDVGVVGGVLHRAPGAKIHGSQVSGGGKGLKVDSDGSNISLSMGDGHGSRSGDEGGWIARKVRDIGGALTRAAMLFVFGTVLLALASRRMETLRLEVAARPMRTFALGVVGVIGGGLLLALVAVTIIGIPVAVVAALAAVFAAYSGMCAVLTTIGAALAGHRTENPYAHLAIGCALFLLVGIIPYVGGLVTATVTLLGIGAAVATRGAGLVKGRRAAEGPYRSATI